MSARGAPLGAWAPEGAAAPALTSPPRGSALAAAQGFALRLGVRALDLVYPPGCLACRAATSAPQTLCSACWTRMRYIERPYCERLGLPFAADLGPGLLSAEAMARPPVFHRARAVALFEDGPTRQLVTRLKYGDRMDLAWPMGRWMARAGAELIEEADALVPMPLHRARLAARRFNQAMALARGVARETGLPVEPFALARVKPTLPQVGLSRLQRAANMQGAFRVAEEARPQVAGRRLILVDDVLTSGATTNAAARALMRAGAAQVDVLVFALVAP